MEPTYTVTELSQVIGKAVTRALPDDVWVEGEIRDLSRSQAGHVYFTLVDPDASEPAAALPVSLFASDREAVNRVLIRSGAMRMTDGVHVRIRGRVGHYAPRATVQLRMTWIDTDFTVGKLAAARQALLRRLEAAGDVGRNARLPMPELPLRIGLITSVGSAAHADFLTELQHSGYGFLIGVVDARVQGGEAAGSIVAALEALESLAADAVAVVRGGGAQTDLAAFDSETVARAIAAAPFPVLTGIGHEIDTTVADHVAAVSLKTPTACAQHLVGIVAAAARRIDAAQASVVRAATAATAGRERETDAATHRVVAGVRMHVARHDGAVIRAAASLGSGARGGPDKALRRLETLVRRTSSAAESIVSVATIRLAGESNRLRADALRAVADAGRRIEALDAVRRAVAPERMLARGWSVTYGADGRLMRSPADVAPGDRIRTRLHGGDILSTVDEDGKEAPTS